MNDDWFGGDTDAFERPDQQRDYVGGNKFVVSVSNLERRGTCGLT
jgi:hypothetical protein